MIEIKEKNNNGARGVEHYYNGVLHREDGPAVILYFFNSDKIGVEEYYINGNQHREDGPSYITYDRNGLVLTKEYHVWTPGQGSGNTVFTERQFSVWRLNKILKDFDLVVTNRLEIQDNLGNWIDQCHIDNIEEKILELIGD